MPGEIKWKIKSFSVDMMVKLVSTKRFPYFIILGDFNGIDPLTSVLVL